MDISYIYYIIALYYPFSLHSSLFYILCNGMPYDHLIHYIHYNDSYPFDTLNRDYNLFHKAQNL